MGRTLTLTLAHLALLGALLTGAAGELPQFEGAAKVVVITRRSKEGVR